MYQDFYYIILCVFRREMWLRKHCGLCPQETIAVPAVKSLLWLKESCSLWLQKIVLASFHSRYVPGLCWENHCHSALLGEDRSCRIVTMIINVATLCVRRCDWLKLAESKFKPTDAAPYSNSTLYYFIRQIFWLSILVRKTNVRTRITNPNCIY